MISAAATDVSTSLRARVMDIVSAMITHAMTRVATAVSMGK
jgi:hypothetical protein